MIVSLISIGVNFGLNWIFTFQLGLGHRGLALSVSLVSITNFLLLYGMMRRHTGRLETGAMLLTLGKIAIAGAVLAAVCLFSDHYVMGPATRVAQWKLILEMIVTIAVGATAFFGTAFLLRVPEVNDVVVIARRKLKV
jgi:peptidoglycan biosynthesis protein MviN/MurJ (putative lipid II flippase)